MYGSRAEQEAIAAAIKEVDLAKRLLQLLDKAGPVAVFFVADEKYSWYDIDACDACEFWLTKQLTAEEKDIYDDLYRCGYMTVSELRSRLSIDSNRIPGPGNIDGY